MLIATLQLLLTTAACWGLWRFVRSFERPDLTSRLVVIGFLIRALGAQLLFWISWLELPLGRSQQIGNGLWFFAMDADAYLRYANDLLDKGLTAILSIDAIYPSHVFLQWFTLGAGAFGVVASTAILLNCAAYLATCALILRMSPAADRARTFAITAVALGPASILWSLQPLKDTFFLLMITLFVALGHEWQKLGRRVAETPVRAIGCAAAMCVAVYGIAGTRWYVGAIFTIAFFIFLPLVASLPRPRLASYVAAAALFVLVGTAFLIGGDGDIPEPIRHSLDPSMLLAGRVEATGNLLAKTRNGFERTGGGTAISPGQKLRPASDHPVPSKPAQRSATKTPHGTEPSKPDPERPAVAIVSASPAAESSLPATPMAAAGNTTAPSATPPPETTLAAKITSGVAAMFLPRALAQRLGLVEIGGGRGFWFFADVDTLLFDAVIVIAFGYCLHRLVRRERRATPLFIMAVLMFVALCGPMSYTVTNFGTLFRLREMLYLLAALLPLTLDFPDSGDVLRAARAADSPVSGVAG